MPFTRQSMLGLPDDFPIEDAEEEVEIIVSPDDIKFGKQRNPEQCAFARAERRVDEDLVRVMALKSILYLIYNDMAVRYKLPAASRKAIAGFDEKGGKKMLPGAYLLKPPQSQTARGNRSEKTKRAAPREIRHSVSSWIRGREPK